MTDTPQRISKFISHAGVCSRRDAERLIDAGRVKVNGKTINSPALNVTPEDVVVVDGQQISGAIEPALWLYHKPKGLITTHKDEQRRETVFDHLPASLGRVISVGRLDKNSEGLLLLTNNGELARYLEHPDSGWTRTYRVRMDGELSADSLRQLKKGVTIDDITYRGIAVQMDKTDTPSRNRWATVRLSEGKNREIRRVLEHFGHPVSRLIRLSYGPFQLGKLPAGEVKPVSKKVLQNAVGKGIKL